MPDYRAMYLKLFRQISNTIEELQEVQRQVEEIYISSENLIINIHERDEDKKQK